MKATDLRIGNYIFGKYEDGNEVEQSVLCRVIALDETGEMLNYKIWVETFGNSNQEYFDDFEPIPLTEEWLLKFGFEEKYGYIKNGVHLNTDYSLFIEDEIGFNEWKADCEYVHQLQNLYFALTGEELIIK